jgi:outer membrane protein TolC
MPLILNRKTSRVALTAIFLSFSLLAEAQQEIGSGGVRRITLPEAQARAGASPVVRAAQLTADAARYHREAVAADYFPKISSTFFNLHFNKLMGERVALPRRQLDAAVLNKDMTAVYFSATQPITPLLKVKQAVNLARADERIAEAKLAETTANVRVSVDPAYFALLIAQFQQKEAASRLEAVQPRTQIANAGVTPSIPDLKSQTELREAEREVSTVRNKVLELTGALNALLGFSAETELELVSPEPLAAETMSLTSARQRAVTSNLEVIEAEQTLAKAEAGVKLGKLEYIPDVAIMGGYAYQTVTNLLPSDFSFLGVVATYTVFDFGRRENTLKERKANFELAQMNLQGVKAKLSAAVQTAYKQMEQTLQIREARRDALVNSGIPQVQEISRSDAARLFRAEAELVQAEWDYRVAYLQLKKVIGER